MSRFTREEERERKDLFLANLTEKMTRLAEKHCLKYIHEQDLAKLAEGAVCLENHYPGEDIFALLVYRSLSRIMTFIITELTYYTIARTPIQVVDQLCHHHHGGNFMPHIRNGIALTLGNKHFVVPFACAKFSLMPLGHTENSVAIWLNPAHIDEIFKVDQQTYVKTSFGWPSPSQ